MSTPDCAETDRHEGRPSQFEVPDVHESDVSRNLLLVPRDLETQRYPLKKTRETHTYLADNIGKLF